MKKSIIFLPLLALFTLSCEKNNQPLIQDGVKVDMSDFYLHTEDNPNDVSKSNNGTRKCYSMANLNAQLNQNPNLENDLFNVEYHTRRYLAQHKGKPTTSPGGGGNGGNGGSGSGSDAVIEDGLGTIQIPVYVHVVYANAQQNISLTQIQSQIDVLNEDFNISNSDLANVPAEFAGNVADVDIQFSLAQVYRYSNSTSAWGTSDAVKAQYPPVTPQTHLNIWVCNIGSGILGYAQFPGGAPSTDGVVISPQYFGTTGYVSAPFNKGRTATHEVGHYLNLRHIWGDGRCKQDDFVNDTPSSDGPNYGCPSYPTVNCKSTDMTMNYMDYVDDACMYMFSIGQRNRMRAIFTPGGARESMIP